MIPVPCFDGRSGGFQAFCATHTEAARGMRRDVLNSHGRLAAFAAQGALPLADRVSRGWLRRTGDPYLNEVEGFARDVGKPGVLTLNLSYEWGCTTMASEGPEGPTLFRVLDWPYPGLGQSVKALRLSDNEGEWTCLTWPAVSSVLQASAPGRFAAAINQAPQRQTGWGRAADWLVGKPRFLRERGMVPGHLLRQVFETAYDYSEACRMLIEAPVCMPVIYTLAGVRDGEGCVIERTESDARVREMTGQVAAANHFATDLGEGRWRSRGADSVIRESCAVEGMLNGLQSSEDFSALPAPIRNPTTRLVMSACPGAGTLKAQGWEASGPATLTTTFH